MSGISNIQIAFDPEINYWEMNPHMIYISPFSELYKKDKGGLASSKQMWCITYICDPDEKENKFFRFGREKCEQMLKETFYPGLDSEDVMYNKCIEEYPHVAMDSIQKSLYDKKLHLRKRANFLISAEYTLESGPKLDGMHSKTAKIMEEYDQVLAKYLSSRKEGIVKGGRAETKSEKREL